MDYGYLDHIYTNNLPQTREILKQFQDLIKSYAAIDGYDRLNMVEFYSEFGIFDVKITLPKDYRLMATGDIVNGDDELHWLDSLAAQGDSLHVLPKKKL